MTRLSEVIEGPERQQHTLAGTPFIPIALDNLNVAVVPDRLDPEEYEALTLSLRKWASQPMITGPILQDRGTTHRVARKPPLLQPTTLQSLTKSGSSNVAANCRR